MRYDGFRKVHEDDASAIMKHKNGSELKIAKKGLSPKHLEDLKSLPLYQADGTYGGQEKDEEPEQKPVQQAPVNIFVGGQPNNQAPAPQVAPQAPAPQPQQAMPSQQPAPQSTLAPQQAEPSQEAAPEQDEQTREPQGEKPQAEVAQPPSQEMVDQVKNTPEGYKAMELQNYAAAGNAWQNDLNSGHIQPKTYHDLFAEKSTLGKVGTLFGLLISGGGSGLSHQPNSILQMMNSEIDRDLKAQQQSKDNAVNYIRANQAHILNQAQAGLTQAEADTKAAALSRIQMNWAAFHSLVDANNKLPNGSPQKQAGDNMLALMYQAINNENFSIADRAAAAGALAKFGSGQGNNFQQGMRALRMSGNAPIAEDIESKTVPGMGQSDLPIPQDVRTQIAAQKQYNEKAKEYVEFANKHKKNWANMNLVDRQRIANQGASMAANLQSLYRNKIKGGVYKKGEQEFIEQIIPDQPAKWSAGFNAIPKVEQTIHDNENDMNNTASQVGLPVPRGTNKKPAPQAAGGGGQEMIPVLSPDGQKMKIPKANLQKALSQGWKKR
jgi:hypothetical protein